MIYFCIPAFDEAATVGVLLWKIRKVMEELPRDYEIFVLDDGSTDGTLDVLAPYARILPLTVIHQDVRRGYSAALERLIREVVGRATHPRRDVLITLQADFTEAPEDIPGLIKRIEGGADLVEVAVVSDGANVPRTWRVVRRGIVPLILRGTPLPDGVRDPLSGFRAYRVSVLKRALDTRNGSPLLTSEGWAANLELLLVAGSHSRRNEAFEVESRYALRQRESRFRPWTTLVHLWNLKRQLRRSPRPMAGTEAAA